MKTDSTFDEWRLRTWDVVIILFVLKTLLGAQTPLAGRIDRAINFGPNRTVLSNQYRQSRDLILVGFSTWYIPHGNSFIDDREERTELEPPAAVGSGLIPRTSPGSGSLEDMPALYAHRVMKPITLRLEKSTLESLEEEADFKGDFTKFDPGEAVIARQGEGYVHGRIEMLQF